MSESLSNRDPSTDQFDKVIRRIEINVPAGKLPVRLDQFLTKQVAELTRSKAQSMISSGEVRINGEQVKPSYKIRPLDLIVLSVLSRPLVELEAEDIPLSIVWEDEWLIVIDKPAGMVVHPAAGNRRGTLVNALLWHYRELAESDDPDRPGIVHRLDKETSGLLVICKREPALSRMAKLFRDHTIEREYRAISWWNMPKRRGVIDQPIGRSIRDRKMNCVRSDGKSSLTHWEQLEKFTFLSYMRLKLETGRTHQIRVHMSHEGHPIFGDPDYGGRNRQMGKLTSAQRSEVAEYFEFVKRQMLHARTLGFLHPVTEEQLFFESPLPEDFRRLLNSLRGVEPTTVE